MGNNIDKSSRFQKEAIFRQNAFLLLENAEKIMSDRRLYLAPVPVHNGLAYGGPFPEAPLVAYLEWWQNYPEYSTVHDPEKGDMLIWLISGSPLSGCHACNGVNRDGETKNVSLIFGFSNTFHSFCKCNNKYQEEKKNIIPYDLEQVIALLRQDSNDEALRKAALDNFFLRSQIKILETKLKNEKDKRNQAIAEWHQYAMQSHTLELAELWIKHNHDISLNKKELETYCQSKAELKKKLKLGILTPKEYQYRLRELVKPNDMEQIITTIGGDGTSLPPLTIAEVETFFNEHPELLGNNYQDLSI